MGLFARVLMGIGAGVFALGGLLLIASRLGLGRLPGDLNFRTSGLHVYLPLGTCVLLSVIGTVVLNLWLRR